MSLLSTLAGDLKRHRASQALRAMPALATYRFGVWCRKQPTPVRQLSGGVYRAALLASETVSGIYLDSATEVGDDLHLIHAGGINIHPASRIGDRVGLMHGVTLAADARGAPVLGDDVFIGADATVYGPVTVGEGASVAANSLVLTDVPPNHMAIGVPAKMVPQFGKKKPKAEAAAGAA